MFRDVQSCAVCSSLLPVHLFTSSSYMEGWGGGQEAGNREQGAGSREQGAGNRKGRRDGELEAGKIGRAHV